MQKIPINSLWSARNEFCLITKTVSKHGGRTGILLFHIKSMEVIEPKLRSQQWMISDVQSFGSAFVDPFQDFGRKVRDDHVDTGSSHRSQRLHDACSQVNGTGVGAVD